MIQLTKRNPIVRLATKYGGLTMWRSSYNTSASDICQLVRHAAVGFIAAALLAGGIALLIEAPIVWIAAMMSLEQWIDPTPAAAMVSVLDSTIIILFSLYKITRDGTLSISDMFSDEFKSSCARFVSPASALYVLMLWFRSVREKMCIRIEVKDEESD